MLPLHLRHRQASHEDELGSPDVAAPIQQRSLTHDRRADRLFGQLALAQGVYFALTGVWALVSLGTFMRITGRKTDTWLVKTVGVLVAVIGATLAIAGSRRSPSDEVATLAAGSAAGLAAIDVVYVVKGRISPVYLLDALAEAGILAGWWTWMRARRKERSDPAAASSGIAL